MTCPPERRGSHALETRAKARAKERKRAGSSQTRPTDPACRSSCLVCITSVRLQASHFASGTTSQEAVPMVRTTRRSATGACTFAPSASGRTRTTSAPSDKATDHLRATAPVYSAEWGAKFSRHASPSSSSQGRLEQVGLSASFGIDNFLVPSLRAR